MCVPSLMTARPLLRPHAWLQVNGASVPPKVPLHIQVFNEGLWRFKGVPDSHRVCLVMPTLLAGRLQQPLGKASSKATCVQPAGGLQHGLWVEVLNLDRVLVDPALLAANSASPGQHA